LKSPNTCQSDAAHCKSKQNQQVTSQYSPR
jgi:hypothetical protein